MGLDIVMYNDKNVRMQLIEIPRSLHEAIFNGTQIWGSYMYLRKIKDYYKTNVRFTASEINYFIEDLRQIKQFVASNYHSDLIMIIEKLSDGSVKTIHVAGD